MLKPRRSGTFKQEYALAERRGMDMSKLDRVMEMLVKEQPLPPR
jgi:mRNA-degrading endonuclease YafQ of YafQ-DinJ toxin-antitoxin module